MKIILTNIISCAILKVQTNNETHEMKITVSKDTGYTVYKFEARKVTYEVLTKDHKEFSVWSNRFGTAGFGRGTLNVYWSVEELAARSKMFADFAKSLTAYSNMLSSVSH